MAKPSVLVVEDDPDIVELLVYNLQREGFVVYAVGDGEKGLALALRKRPDVVLLDLMLPGMDGLEVCRRLRTEDEGGHLPVIMLTAKGEETDVVLGLELGADDYITKPFSPREVLARVRALIRRKDRGKKGSERKRIELQGLVLDAERFEATLGEELLILTRAEFRLLWALCSRPGRVFTRDELVDRITAGESLIIDRNVDVHISAIRRKLGAAGDLIATVRGVGYKCKD
jgi:two-component system, OmpR family, phosphate regulon response regulator PhoB